MSNADSGDAWRVRWADPADRRHLVEALAILFKASTAKRKNRRPPGFRTKFCDLQSNSRDPSRNCSRSR